LYIVATGGNPGLAPGTSNPAIAMMSALGPCTLNGGQLTLDPTSFIWINEVTTVASVYAMSGFMAGDATHVGTSNTNAVGVANAIGLVSNLVNPTAGVALTTTLAGNGTAPQATINALGNTLAACVNSDGTGTACSALFAAATPSGGTAPTDTIQAVFDIARNPANNVSTLFALASPTPPFQPTLPTAPNDWTLAVTYTGGGLSATNMAIDASGNAWFASSVFGGPYSVTEVSNNGSILSGANGYSVGTLTNPGGIAIDPAGNVWVSGSGQVAKLSSSGSLLSGANGFTGGGLNTPSGIAVDGQGNAWVSDSGSKSLIKLDNSGNILSGASGFTTGANFAPGGMAIDSAGDAWVVDGSNLSEFSNSGSVVSGSGYAPGLSPLGLAFDGTGNAWVSAALCCTAGYPQNGLNNVAKVSSSGAQLSPAGGYANCVSPGIVGSLVTQCLWWAPNAFALDGAGNVWSEVAWEITVNGRNPDPKFSFAVAEMSNTGTILSGATGYTGGTSLGTNPAPGGVSAEGIAIDGSGNVWVLFGGSVAEFVGAGTPVVTPFSAGVKNGTLGARP
jgi:hypothetical protein